MPRISSANTAPIVANCSRCSGRASAFAPASMRTDGPSRAGMGTAIAGRITPGRRRSSSRPAANMAPVFPAETTASASPFATARTAETSELSGLPRTASAGLSSISMTPFVLRSSSPCVSVPAEPYRMGASVSPAASSAPATTSAGPRSPPIASTAIRVGMRPRLRGVDAERLDLAPLVRPTVRTDVMRPLRNATVRADVHLRRLDRVRRTPLVAARAGLSSLRDGHEGAQYSLHP